ncbi:DNA/RNA non-specific endonuclease [Latilactobacillus fuchuensis]|uniref:Extracellular/cell surface DNA-entry nuclease n=2 Tax=Latilactobacillus fuchuensis TaxID=164393 RepID=A0A2N9DUY6_9LACO|nr:DNA/RNA non-specific endonuclease [Latilactobacillus fuchuensis]KRL61349.1 hypothetical protein FC69_GL000831 [Latilactobacillus fuchuensis DSM 14340 = JCM 11249]MCP8857206.1 DNA/RNA non-specific endonuclease [Latilactobacillus fuchuensis]SPC38249.1 Extracellular/cell surface DNA-entry nuclease [Latilactobacillus fuchuensis]
MKFKKLASAATIVAALAVGYHYGQANPTTNQASQRTSTSSTTTSKNIAPEYSTLAARDFKSGDAAYLPVNDGKSTLSIANWQTEKIDYGALDALNRTTTVTGYLSNRNLGKSEGRSSQNWQPTGWHNQPVTINGRRMTPQNRGHLLAYTITFNFDQNGHYQQGTEGSLDNPLNLATQSEYSNQKTMQIFEEKVRDALAARQKVIYQVTTVFRGNELMPRGYWVQAISSDGSLNFNDYVWNIEPGLQFDYATGRSSSDATTKVSGFSTNEIVEKAKQSIKQPQKIIQSITDVFK